MATQRINISRTVAEQTQAWETGADEQYPDFSIEPDYSGQADVCSLCGEPIGWHEQACQPRSASALGTPTVVEPIPKPQDGFTFTLGSLVLSVTQQSPHPIIWRGQLRERHPDTGLLLRVPVYRLADGHWDCYREEELRVA